MADIQVFNHPEFGSIRTLDDGGRTLFCGADIAKALGYSNTPQSSYRPLQRA